ncbi:hypothetical protein FACS1894122_01560 [Alphaproteobacteria bacterium]|nr:hypothetical protein FACS1894122_01560 [Alphaproteobacteria bacterium]
MNNASDILAFNKTVDRRNGCKDAAGIFIADYVPCRFGKDRVSASDRYMDASNSCIAPSLQPGVINSDVARERANILVKDETFLNDVDAQIERIKNSLLPQKESFLKAVDDALLAVSTHIVESKIEKSDAFNDLRLNHYDDMNHLLEGIVEKVKQDCLLKEDEYGDAILFIISRKLGLVPCGLESTVELLLGTPEIANKHIPGVEWSK